MASFIYTIYCYNGIIMLIGTLSLSCCMYTSPVLLTSQSQNIIVISMDKSIQRLTEVNACAIIPARGGSKGIPHKNISLLAGKPLLAHTIECAYKAQSIKRVIVSTDDKNIALVAKQYRGEVIMRPPDISGDKASSESALLHVLTHLHDVERYEPEIVVFLQCTSPLTVPEDIDGTMKALFDNHADTALAVAPFHYFLWQRHKDGSATGIGHDKEVRLLRQEREPHFRETGGVYIMRTKGFKKAQHRFFGKTSLYVLPNERCLEIDNPEDFLIAEILMREFQKKQKIHALPDRISMLVLDFDGVFTNNKVIVAENGREAVVCDRGDGWGICQLKRKGVPILVLSTEKNPVVKARCEKLGIEYIQGVDDKLSVLQTVLAERNMQPEDVIYVGNDLNDLDCLRAVGCAVVVRDAHRNVQAVAKIILSTCGGNGAIREICELIEQKLEG
ncbi:MAG: cytidylyltransferase domain-containing protein [bacterium]